MWIALHWGGAAEQAAEIAAGNPKAKNWTDEAERLVESTVSNLSLSRSFTNTSNRWNDTGQNVMNFQRRSRPPMRPAPTMNQTKKVRMKMQQMALALPRHQWVLHQHQMITSCQAWHLLVSVLKWHLSKGQVSLVGRRSYAHGIRVFHPSTHPIWTCASTGRCVFLFNFLSQKLMYM